MDEVKRPPLGMPPEWFWIWEDGGHIPPPLTGMQEACEHRWGDHCDICATCGALAVQVIATGKASSSP